MHDQSPDTGVADNGNADKAGKPAVEIQDGQNTGRLSGLAARVSATPKYACILTDPPWAFRTYSGKDSTPHRGAHDHYVTTKTAQLEKIPVADWAEKNCALFMWVVDSHFDEALELGRAWGFEFKTCAFVWVKSKAGGWPHVGMGYWTRKQVEQCWLFTRGKPKRLGKGVEQIIHCPRGAHSAKPDQQYDRIEALVGGPYLEMFSRSTRNGWAAWGNETGVRDGSLF